MKQIIVSLIVLLASACTKTGFTSNSGDASSAAAFSASGGVAGMDGSQGVIVTGDNESAEDESGDVNQPDDQAAAASCADFFSGKVNASLSQPLVMKDSVTMSKVEGELVIDANALSLEDIRGPVLAMFETASQIDNLRGTVCLLGQNLNNVTATGQLTNHRGHAEVQDVDMSLIEDTRGTLVIHGGSVASIKNHRGNIQLIDTVVGDIDDVRGEIDLQGTSKITGSVTDSDPVVQK